MPTPVATAQIIEVIARLQTGESSGARVALEAMWKRLGPTDFFHRCVVAHYLADAQTDPKAELAWDELALEAATQATPADFDGRFPGMTLASFFPSLHLNLAADFEKLADLPRARAHAQQAEAHARGLDDSELARLTKGAIARLLDRTAKAP